jgi:serine phosphatase RsbU (regulator of sigma subunit)
MGQTEVEQAAVVAAPAEPAGQSEVTGIPLYQGPQYETLEIDAVSTPAFEVGGDYYDFVELSDHMLGIVVGDVSGKGVSAAFICRRSGHLPGAEQNVSFAPEFADQG